jgi:hypothetical protein
MLGNTWTETWLGDGSVEVDQLLGILVAGFNQLNFFVWGYVKKII